MSGYWFPKRAIGSGKHPPAWVWLFPPFWFILIPGYLIWCLVVLGWFLVSIPVNLVRLAMGAGRGGVGPA